MGLLRNRKLYLPAVTIIAVVAMLLVLIGLSTYRNLDRQQKRALAFLNSQGTTLLRSLEAGVRTGIRSGHWQDDSVGRLVREMARNADVAYIYLFNPRGVIVHASDPARVGRHAQWTPALDDERQVKWRIRELHAGTRIYELAKLYAPFRSLPPALREKDYDKHAVSVHTHRGDTIVVGLNMAVYEAARRQDLRHAVVMAAILLVVGSGALFFIFVTQNYYLVDRALKESRDYTRQVVSSMANGLLSVDPEGRITSWNQLALELLGLAESQVRGRRLEKFLDFESTGIGRALYQCRPSLDREILLRRAAGDEMPLGVSASPILTDDKLCNGAVVILRDLREIKRLEENVRRNERLAAIGRLAAGVAHEIRNPLSSIRGFAQYLRHVLAEKPDARQYADVIIREMDRINRVVSDLLTFARPRRLAPRPADVRELVDHVVRLVEADAAARHIAIQKRVAPDTRTAVLDAAQMTQALLNLALNALQAVDEEGTIIIGARRRSDGIHFWVEDDGPGIPAEARDKVFDPFFTSRETGSGLGLAIVHKIAENHGGEVCIDSPAGGRDRGCRVTIILPPGAADV
jgi:two-component system sensor histidine kinase HydH